MLRLSGSRTLDIVESRVRVVGEEHLSQLGGFRQIEVELDWRGLAVGARLAVYRAPRSSTGEDVAELTVPGSVPLLASLLRIFLAESSPGAGDGARLARPGEFTFRALLNGKIDLTQAEAVGRLIHAGGEREARAAYRQLGGALRDRVGEIDRSITEILALVEAAIDFPDEDIPVVAPGALAPRVESVRRAVEDLLGHSALRIPQAGTLRVALLGPPNAGKSSLLNALVGRPLALVSDLAGTTRDPVRGFSTFRDWRLEWVDLAGLEESAWSLDAAAAADSGSSGESELRAAIRRVCGREMDSADLLLWVVDGTDTTGLEPRPGEAPISPLDTDRAQLLVVAKSDLLTEAEIELWTSRSERPVVVVSSRSGSGLHALLDRVVAVAQPPGATVRDDAGDDAALLLSPLQEQQLRQGLEALQRSESGLESGGGYELVASDLRDALLGIAPLTGREVAERVLGAVFGQFCIGK